MAKKIEWTETSIQDRDRMYHFLSDQNKTDSYRKKVEILFNEAAKLISQFPDIGTETDYPDLRVKVVRSYKLFYINDVDRIQIVRVWDSRQNPSEIEFP